MIHAALIGKSTFSQSVLFLVRYTFVHSKIKRTFEQECHYLLLQTNRLLQPASSFNTRLGYINTLFVVPLEAKNPLSSTNLCFT